MWRDNMIQISNQGKTKLLSLGKMVGINKRDIDEIINSLSLKNKPISLSLGPSPYEGGGYYGTVSIRDFEN